MSAITQKILHTRGHTFIKCFIIYHNVVIMASAQRNIQGTQRHPTGQRVKTFLRKNCVPTLVEDIITVRKAKAAGEDVGKRPYLRAVGMYLGRVALSAGIHFGSAATFGVLAWQTQPGAPSTDSLDNASPVASGFAAFIANLVPPHQQMTYANIMLGADMLLSAIRIGVEQAVWRKYKVTPDFPGTMVSPLVVGAGEMLYKTAALANTPDDPRARLAQGIKGVYGNLVRLAMAGVIYAAGRLLKRNEAEKKA